MGAGHGGHIIKIDSIENPDYTIGTANKYVVLSGRNTGGIGGLQWQRMIIINKLRASRTSKFKPFRS